MPVNFKTFEIQQKEKPYLEEISQSFANDKLNINFQQFNRFGDP